MAESDTPRTDALHAKCIEIEALCWMAGREYVVMRELARTLERELATLRERLAEAERWKEEYRDRLTFEEQETKKAEQRAERAEALAEQNAKDAERWRGLVDCYEVNADHFIFRGKGTVAQIEADADEIFGLNDAARKT